MKHIIKKILKEELQNQQLNVISNFFDEIKTQVENQINNVQLTQILNKDKNKGWIDIDVTNNDTNYKKIYQDVREIVDQTKNKNKVFQNSNTMWDFFHTISFSPNERKKFINSDYIKERKEKIDELKLKEWEFITDFDGVKSDLLEKKLIQVDLLSSDAFYDELKSFIQTKTDVPLDIRIRTTGSAKTAFITIIPKLSLDDFLNCKYKKWEFPFDIWEFYEEVKGNFSRKYPETFHNSLGPLLTFDIIWSREIGNFITNQNKILRDRFPETFKSDVSIMVNYTICANDPKIYTGLDNYKSYTPEHTKLVTQLKKELFPTAKINYLPTKYWQIKKSFDPTDQRYWSKDELFSNFIKRAQRTYGNIYQYDISRFTDMNTPTEVFCEKHQNWFKVIPSEHLKGKRCPFDNESKGEKLVRVYLENNNIKFLTYHRIKDCFSELNGRCYTLPFDFYLPELNILIEYDGEQHFKTIDIWGGEEGFNRRQHLDSIKNRFAKDNGIKLIRIPYTVKNENQLSEYLSELL